MVISTRFPRRRLSQTVGPNRRVTAPAIQVSILGSRRAFDPEDEIECEYEVIAADRNAILAVEASVLWYTEGKGEEDMAVHFFERRALDDVVGNDLRPCHRFRTELPNTPISYHGEILQIRWCVRVRVYLKEGGEISQDLPFQLGDMRRSRRRRP